LPNVYSKVYVISHKILTFIYQNDTNIPIDSIDIGRIETFLQT